MTASEKDRLTRDKNPSELEKQQMVGVLELFRFATWVDKLFIFLGSISAMGNGMGMPMVSWVFGESVDIFVNAGRLELLMDDIPEFMRFHNLTKEGILEEPSILKPYCPGIDAYYNFTDRCIDVELDEPLTEEIKDYVMYFIIIGITVVICGMGQVAFWTIAAERQANRIRDEFFKNILRQDIGWFDTNDAAELNSRLASDMVRIQTGLGDKTGTIIQYVTTFVGGYIIGFIKGWKEALVLVAISPALFLAGGIYSYVSVAMTAKEQSAYGKAGAIAEEVLGAVRTVVAFGGEKKEIVRYENQLGAAQKMGRNKGMAHGLSTGFLYFVNFCTYALGLWYGGKLVRDDEYEVNEVLVVYLAISLGTFSLGATAPGFQAIAEARAAATGIYGLINLKSKIDSSSPDGKKPDYIKGHLKFQNVHFSYPARPDVKILNNLNMEVKPGQTIALVGSSGCGKSTIVQLLLRFYDTLQGQVLMDGVDLRDLNIKWLRTNIGLVSQEPILFDTTIFENIRYGADGVTKEDILQAAKNANAYDFISRLPNQFNTRVGEGGTQLSGGQKQRIAIARALVKDPKILLLDEATSALDTASESVVQDALDKARQGRTTVVVAHRLSTIRTADLIIGMDKGEVKEKGTHEQLMAERGIYYTLVMNQTKDGDKTENDGEVAPHKPIKPLVRSMSDEGAPERGRLMSISSNPEEEEEEAELNYPSVSFTQLLRENANEWHILVVGCIGAIVFGGCQPAFAMVFSEILKVYAEDDETMKDEIQKYAMYLVGIGILSLLSSFVQSWMFAVAGEALTRRLRRDTLKAMLRQEMGWFDLPNNSTGALTYRLSNDASQVQGAAGTQLGSLMQNVIAMSGAIILALIYGWQLTLVILGFFPLLLLGGVMQMKVMKGNLGSAKEALNDAGKVAVEAFQNMRTVSSLCKEKEFQMMYSSKLKLLLQDLYKKASILGIIFSFSQSVVHFSLASVFAFGAKMIEDDKMDSGDVFKVFSCITFCGVFLGQASAFGPDIGKAKAAARRIFFMVQRQSEINTESTDGIKLDENTYRSEVKFKDAKFNYPLRPDVKVLRGLSFSVQQGQTVALVGSSGCGKSTCITLLERFYSLLQGSVSLDSQNIESMNISWIRSQIGLVSQEPVLFDCTIRENIAYGDNSRSVHMDEIISVAKQANIHNFITGLPQGYETNVGGRGTQLSGGQKQRIAIARALVRNPRILLLDEATSALDTESEKVVQEALDKARVGRTCITIAHRLSTIRDADKIIVIDSGKAVEEGTHDELMKNKGIYYNLQQVQNKR